MESSLDATDIVRLLASPDRLRLCAALVLGASTRPELVERTGLTERQLDKALARLMASGLVARQGGTLTLLTEHLEQASRSATATAEEDPPIPDDLPREAAEAAKVMRTFVRKGRMASIPAARSKRLVLLDWLAQRFEPGRRYAEREVNDILREVHPDVAALRRYLVDEGFLDRLHGEYWRVGGTFPVG
jgi:hypothetical protein